MAVDRTPSNPALTRDGILAEERARMAEREDLRKRAGQRYDGPVADPLPGQFEDLLADERTDWDAIQKEADCPD